MRKLTCLVQVRELEAGTTPYLCVATGGGGTAAATHRVECMLKRGHQRALTCGEGHEEIAPGRGPRDSNRTGAPQGHARKADESFDAARQPRGLYFRALATDLIYFVPGCAQASPALLERFVR